MGIRLTTTRWMLASLAAAAIAIGADYVLEPAAGGAVLVATALFIGLAEGAVCLMAGAEISDGHWHRPLLTRAASLVWICARSSASRITRSLTSSSTVMVPITRVPSSSGAIRALCGTWVKPPLPPRDRTGSR